jgi:hypothetical protein
MFGVGGSLYAAQLAGGHPGHSCGTGCLLPGRLLRVGSRVGSRVVKRAISQRNRQYSGVA